MPGIQSVPPFRPGMMSVKAAHLNAMLNAIKGLGGGTGPTGFTASDFWWGVIVEAPGAEAEYTDARYWVQPMHCTNAAGADTVQATIDAVDEAEDDPIYGTVTASNLAELADSSHGLPLGFPVLVTVFYDEQAPAIARYCFCESKTTYTLFACKVWRDGGTTDGDAITACDRTYTARTMEATAVDTGGILLGEDMTPTEIRPTDGKLVTPPVDGGGKIGRGYYDEEGDFQLLDANETFAVAAAG